MIDMHVPKIDADSPQEVIDAYVAGYDIGYRNGLLDSQAGMQWRFGRSSLAPHSTQEKRATEAVRGDLSPRCARQHNHRP